MAEPDIAFASLEPGGGDRFQTLRRQLGVGSFGINLITLEPRQLPRGELVRVGPAVRRQLVNRGPDRLVLLALGGSGNHVGRDGRAWTSWDDEGEGRPPQQVPLPEDLPR